MRDAMVWSVVTWTDPLVRKTPRREKKSGAGAARLDRTATASPATTDEAILSPYLNDKTCIDALLLGCCKGRNLHT